jgi:hypothetical protein
VAGFALCDPAVDFYKQAAMDSLLRTGVASHSLPNGGTASKRENVGVRRKRSQGRDDKTTKCNGLILDPNVAADVVF